MHNTWVPTDLHRSGDRSPVLDLRHGETQNLSRTCQAVVSGLVKISPCADERDWQRLLDTIHAPRLDDLRCTQPFLGRQGPSQERQILVLHEQDGPIELHVFQQMDLCCDGSGHVRCVPGDFAISLHSMHVAKVNATPLHFAWNNEDGTCTRMVDVHVAVCAVHHLILCDCQGVGCTNQECRKVASIMRVRKRDGWATADLAHERPSPAHHADQMVRRKSKNRVLCRVGGHCMVVLCVARDRLSGMFGKRHTNLPKRVESHGVPICELEWCRALAIGLVLNGVLTDTINICLGVELVCTCVMRRTEGVPLEFAIDCVVVPGRRGH
mmetsp:Transcript_16208/g.25907  ORF Transcript_16208/g.25907 Transcript_16208/m.25907 type:complete len:325 (+) Transcript_16208:351-1325(+)